MFCIFEVLAADHVYLKHSDLCNFDDILLLKSLNINKYVLSFYLYDDFLEKTDNF